MTQRGVMFETMHAMTRSFKCDVYCPITRLLAHPMLCIVVTMDDGHKYRPGVWQENFPLGPASVSWPHLPGLDYWGGAIGRRKGSCYPRKQLKLFGLFVKKLEQFILFVLNSVYKNFGFYPLKNSKFSPTFVCSGLCLPCAPPCFPERERQWPGDVRRGGGGRWGADEATCDQRPGSACSRLRDTGAPVQYR